MRRRKFITLTGGVAAGWPVIAYGQRLNLPSIGFLHSSTDDPQRNAAFKRRLSGFGYVQASKVRTWKLSAAGRKAATTAYLPWRPNWSADASRSLSPGALCILLSLRKALPRRSRSYLVTAAIRSSSARGQP
jgi:hypothetical protein